MRTAREELALRVRAQAGGAMRAALLGVVTSSLHEGASGFVDPLDEHEGVASA